METVGSPKTSVKVRQTITTQIVVSLIVALIKTSPSTVVFVCYLSASDNVVLLQFSVVRREHDVSEEHIASIYLQLQGVTAQKTALFVVTAVWISNPV
jgi:RNase adaptor protein for sRNA GlmZ degradation